MKNLTSAEDLAQAILSEDYKTCAAKINLQHQRYCEESYYQGFLSGSRFGILCKNFFKFLLVILIVSFLSILVHSYYLIDKSTWKNEIAACRSGNYADCQFAISNHTTYADRNRKRYLEQIYFQTTGRNINK